MESTAQSGFTQTRSTNHQKKNTSDVIIEGEFYEDDESKDWAFLDNLIDNPKSW